MHITRIKGHTGGRIVVSTCERISFTSCLCLLSGLIIGVVGLSFLNKTVLFSSVSRFRYYFSYAANTFIYAWLSDELIKVKYRFAFYLGSLGKSDFYTVEVLFKFIDKDCLKDFDM